jgi:Tfp pilus assembly protein PilF
LLADLDVPRTARPDKQQFVASMPQVRLDSLENYVRGAITVSPAEKVRRFKEAVRISPDYTYAKLQLARTYFAQREYEQAATWFAKIPRTATQALEATFFYGICEYYLGDFIKAQDAFQYVASRLPLTEIENNLGVVSARRGKPSADYFRRAVQTDPNDPDYHFNLAIALYQSGDNSEALKHAREVLARSSSDPDARALIDTLQRSPAVSQSAAQPRRSFFPRLKREYNEATFRQAELELRTAEELTMAAKGTERHAESHTERGEQMLASGFIDEAEREFREAITVDPQLPAAHLGLARTALQRNDLGAARSELNRALTLDPRNEQALKLKTEIAARTTSQ